MATSNIKRIVSEAIASYLSANVTGLANLVSAVQEGPEKVTTFPSVALLPSSFLFNPSEPDEVYNYYDAGDEPLVLDVGEFEGTIELQLYTNSKPSRELMEQRIMDLFLSQEGSPGTLFITLPALPINGNQTLYQPEIKVRLQDEEWREEFSFEARRYTFIDLSVAFPALTTLEAHTIEALTLGINEDLESDVADESVIVAEDGSVS